MTAPKIFAPEYYTHMAALEAASWWNAGMRDLAERLFRVARLPARGTMLDVGCGSGQTMRWFRELHPGWSTVGFDLSFDGLRAAREAGGESVLAASALEIPLQDRSVDLAITLDVLQHLPLDGGDGQALREMHRVLRPGGALLIRTNVQTVPFTPDDPTYSFHKYSSQELRDRLESAGFDVLRLGRVNALLGLAEIPRELRARRAATSGYVGHLSTMPRRGLSWQLKRAWLGVEGRLVAAGASLPMGRTHLVLARVPA